MEISQVIDRIESGALALPMFQRGYVWNRPQVKKLFRSIYLGYPVGGLLIWETDAGSTDVRAGQAVGSGTINLLLDGQQRATSLYGVIKGDSPKFLRAMPMLSKTCIFIWRTKILSFAPRSKWPSIPGGLA